MTDDYVERATTLHGSEAPQGDRLDNSESFRDYYDRLSVANSLDWNGKWRDESRETVKNSAAIVDAIAGQLELTDFQQEKAHHWFSELPPRYNRSKSTALLALCVCGLAGADDGRNYHPNQARPASKIDNGFATVANDLDISYRNLVTTWHAVRSVVE